MPLGGRIASLSFSNLSISIYYGLQSDIWVKIYGRFEFSKCFLVKFWVSQYIMGLNRKFELKVMPVWIFQEAFVHFLVSWYIMGPIGLLNKMLWLFGIARGFLVDFRVSRYIMCFNWTSESKVMTILISRELPLFNFERLDVLRNSIKHPSKNLLLFELASSLRFQFRIPRYITGLNQTSE